MKIENIKTNLKIMCEQNNITYEDFLIYCLHENTFDCVNNFDKTLSAIKTEMNDEYNLLWDLQPSLEEDEEHAFAIQHARDIIDTLLGRLL